MTAQALRAAVAGSAGARGGHIGKNPSQALTEPHVADRCRIPPLHSSRDDPLRWRWQCPVEEDIPLIPLV